MLAADRVVGAVGKPWRLGGAGENVVQLVDSVASLLVCGAHHNSDGSQCVAHLVVDGDDKGLLCWHVTVHRHREGAVHSDSWQSVLEVLRNGREQCSFITDGDFNCLDMCRVGEHEPVAAVVERGGVHKAYSECAVGKLLHTCGGNRLFGMFAKDESLARECHCNLVKQERCGGK